MLQRPRRLLLTLASSSALCLGVAATTASTAAADSSSGQGCQAGAVSQVFSSWGDQSSYELAPAGDFEGSGWALQNGAAIVDGSETYAATGTLGSSSLSLPAGASATSPTFCLDVSEPTLRFFDAGSGTLLVQIVDGNLTIPAGVASADGSWSPSPVVTTRSKLLGLLSGGSAQVSIKLTALSGQPQVDDVFIDPWFRG